MLCSHGRRAQRENEAGSRYVNNRVVRVNVAIAVVAFLLLSVVALRAVFADGSSASAGDSVTTPSETDPGQDRVRGDFDGDGQEDLAVVENVGNDVGGHFQIRVQYSRPTREGTPRRRDAVRPNPIAAAGLGYEDTGFSLTAGDADGDRATDLVVTAHGDGEQTPSVLLHGRAGAGGFAARAQYLRTGSSVAFGDFDGDGKGDIAVGDSGSRNGEPEGDAQDPAVHDTVTVYYGGDRPAKLLKPGANGIYSTEDLNHDGRDELLIGFEGGVVLNGSADGLTVKDDGVSGWAIGAGIAALVGSGLLVVRHRRRKASRSGPAKTASWLTRFEREL